MWSKKSLSNVVRMLCGSCLRVIGVTYSAVAGICTGAVEDGLATPSKKSSYFARAVNSTVSSSYSSSIFGAIVPKMRATILSQNEPSRTGSKSSPIDKSTDSLSVASVNDVNILGLASLGAFSFCGVTNFVPMFVEQTNEYGWTLIGDITSLKTLGLSAVDEAPESASMR